jgi:hypothetical protein
MLARTQVTLDSELHRKARVRAAALGLSLAEYLRRLVAADLGDDRPSGRIDEIFDLGDSGGSDIQAHKDAYLAAAIKAEPHPRE